MTDIETRDLAALLGCREDFACILDAIVALQYRLETHQVMAGRAINGLLAVVPDPQRDDETIRAVQDAGLFLDFGQLPVDEEETRQ